MRVWSVKLNLPLQKNESSADNKIKNEIEPWLSKYKHGNNTYEHGKQQDEWTT